MLTLPVAGTADANPSARILAIGRSPTVLSELVTILRARGYAAGATNEFDRVLDLFDAGRLDLVIFGGAVPPDTREHLQEEISARSRRVVFVRGHAGIAGLVAAQVEEALGGDTTAQVAYGPRSIRVSLDAPRGVTVTAWWHTSIVPPEPESTSRVILDGLLDAGDHTIAIPDDVPALASFVTVSVGSAVHTFVLGPVPGGTTPVSPRPSTPAPRA